ncbi:MAG: ABC transporter permease [Actinomycetota bacterium]|nr:ABC transporter permease [Actinomycetota bacterium]
MISKLKLLFSEAVRSLGANLSTTIAATMTVLIGMFLLGLFIALGTWVVSWSDHVKKELLVKVYFCTTVSCGTEATPKQMNAVREKLIAMPWVKDVTFVSKEDALKQERRKHPEYTQDLPSNPLPNSYNALPRHGEDVDKIAAALKPAPPGVEKVNYGRKTAHRVLRVAKVIEALFLVAVLILLVASALLISNTIRLSIFARRREIEVMKLVGATNWFVRGPFMLEGLICGIAGSLGAVILLVLGKEIALPAILGHINSGSGVHAISFAFTTLMILGAGLLLGAAGSGLTIRRFLQV